MNKLGQINGQQVRDIAIKHLAEICPRDWQDKVINEMVK
jgi:hypothetical protein